MTLLLEPPAQLPFVHGLSLSSINLLKRCPTKWYRRYGLGEYEPPTGKMLLGSAVGAAEGENFQQKITSGLDLALPDVLDAFSDEWEERLEREEPDLEGENPGVLKDSGARALTAYHQEVAPSVLPVSVERKFSLTFEGAQWTFTGYLDVEDAGGYIRDLKVKAKKLSQADADSDPQPTSYLLARRAEGNPAEGFLFDTMVRTKNPYAEVIRTGRSDGQLDAFAARIVMAAREIVWRAENDTWDGAPPGAWWCSAKFCGFHASCVFGGGA